MQYQVAQLWDVLQEMERADGLPRTAGWLGRRTGYSAQYFRLIRMGKRPVSEAVARKVSAVLDLPIEALFSPYESTKVDEKDGKVDAAA